MLKCHRVPARIKRNNPQHWQIHLTLIYRANVLRLAVRFSPGTCTFTFCAASHLQKSSTTSQVEGESPDQAVMDRCRFKLHVVYQTVFPHNILNMKLSGFRRHDALHTQTFECLKQQWGPLVIGQFLTTQEVILGYCSGLRSCDAQTRGSPGVPACRLEGKKSCRRSISVTEHMRPSWQKLLDTHWRRCAGCLLRRWVTPNRPQLLSVEENCRHVDEINAKYRDELWNAVFSASVESRALIKIQKQASRCFEILNLTSYINCDVRAANLKSELKCELERHHESKRNEARSQNSKLELN